MKNKPHLLEPLVRRATLPQQSGPGMEQPPVRRAKAVLAELERWLIREKAEARRDMLDRDFTDGTRTWMHGYRSALDSVEKRIARIKRQGLRAANAADQQQSGGQAS